MRWPRILRRKQRLAEHAREMEFYLQAETEDKMARGMSREEAYWAARRKLGNPSLIREDIYRMTSAALAESILQDVRYGLRQMRRNLAFTLTAALTLAIGIGGNTAIFSVVRAVLLSPLQYRDPDRLVQVSADYPRRGLSDTTFTKRQFDQVKGSAHSFTAMGAYLSSQENVILSGPGEPEALKAARVSADFLSILGVRPRLGRGFLPEEEGRGGADVAMISARLWQQKFEGSARILGKTVDFNATPYTIVGVLPEGFTFPSPDVDVWVTKPSEWSAFPTRYWDISTTLLGFARLKPGVSLQQAGAEMDVLNRRYAMADPGRYVASMRLGRLSEQVVADIRPTLWILSGAVGFVLLIACANVASLLLARASSRSREFAVRAAIGADRGRLMRQLLAESVVLALLGGALGFGLAKWTLTAVPHVAALNLPGIAAIRLDSGVLGFTLALSVLTGILFGLFPSLQVARAGLSEGLRESGATAGKGVWGHGRGLTVSVRGLLVVAQVALSMVLLIGAVLLIKSFARLQSVDPGFQASNLLTAKIALPPARYGTGPQKLQFFNALLQRVQTVPGVTNAAIAMSLPTTNWLRTNIQIEGKPWDPDPGNWPTVQIQSVTPRYFRTLEIPIERGREFDARDNTPGATPAVIVNESFARRFWPTYPRGQDPVGQHLREGADKTEWVEIIGIVSDVHEGTLAGPVLPEFYVPCVIHPPQTAYLVLRTQGEPLRLVGAVRKELINLDADEPLADVRTMNQVLKSPFGSRRLTTLLVASFAGMAALLAVVGIYGLIAYSVAQRTQEVGVRRALGAQRGDILRLVLTQALALSLIGIAAGALGALLLTRIIRNMLFHVNATDPTTFLITAALFVAVALAASFVPAQRAARIDPMKALRIG